MAYFNHVHVDDFNDQIANAIKRLEVCTITSGDNQTRALDAENLVASLRADLALVQAEVDCLKGVIQFHVSDVAKYKEEKEAMKAKMSNDNITTTTDSVSNIS
ncbi:hypothetical protein ACFE04_026184 [Oxalis oulophora]